MAYVQRFDHDIFISYAQVAEKEWVRGFREKLQEHLDRELHQDKVTSIFWDRNQLDGDSPLTASIAQALSNTATLLIVLSKAYLERPWCRQERESFFNQFGTSSRRAFVVLLEDVPIENRPLEIQALEVLGFQFWEQHPGSDKLSVTRPLPLDEDQFDARIRELAAKVSMRLSDLKNDQPTEIQPVSVAQSKLAGAKVFLADGVSGPPAKELVEARDTVRNWLKDQGAIVLPAENGSLYEAFYDDREQCEATISELLNDSTIFVQLFGAKCDDEGYESWLCERAKDANKVPGKDLLLWRANSLTVENINSDKHRDLVFNEDYHVISCDLSEFQPLLAKHIQDVAIERTLRASSAVTADEGQTQTCGLVLVDNDDPDTPLADQLRSALERSGIGYYSVFNDFNEFSQMALNNTVDAVVFTFGNCEGRWAHKHYQATRPLWLNKKSRPCVGVMRGNTDRPLPTSHDAIFVINANNPADIEEFAQKVRDVAK